MSTCRICGKAEYDHDYNLVRYSIRHSVHTDCGLKKWGADFFDKLTPWQCENQLPFLLVKKMGLEEAFHARIASKEPTTRIKNTTAYKLKMIREAQTL